MKKSDIIVHIPNDAYRMACSHPAWVFFQETAIPKWGMVDIVDGYGTCPICGCRFVSVEKHDASMDPTATTDPYENSETCYEN